MTPRGRPVEEDDLHAGIDGQLPHARSEDVEAYLAAHPESRNVSRNMPDSGRRCALLFPHTSMDRSRTACGSRICLRNCAAGDDVSSAESSLRCV